MVTQNYTNHFRLWLAQKLIGREPLHEAIRRQEREQCVDLIRKLAERWGQSDSDIMRALLEELRGPS